MKNIIKLTEADLYRIVKKIIYEQTTNETLVSQLRLIMKNAGVPTSEGKPTFGLNELNFLLKISESTSNIDDKILKINEKLKLKGNPELTAEEKEVVKSYFEENDTDDIENAIKEKQKEIEKKNKEIVKNQKQDTYTYGTDKNSSCKPGRICPKPKDVIGLPNQGGFQKSFKKR